MELLRGLFKAANQFSQMFLRTWPVWTINLLLWLFLSYVGQAVDLLRVIKSDMARHLFFYMAVGLAAGTTAASISVLLRMQEPLVDDTTGDRFQTFLRHFVPTAIAILSSMLPLAPFYGVAIDAARWTQGLTTALPAFTPAINSPDLAATLGDLDRLPRLVAVLVILFARFWLPKVHRFHRHLALYAAVPAILTLKSMSLGAFLLLTILPIMFLDGLFAYRREIMSCSFYSYLLATIAWLLLPCAILVLLYPAYWSLLVGPVPILLLTASLLLLVTVAWLWAPAWVRLGALILVVALVSQGVYGRRPVRLIHERSSSQAASIRDHATLWLEARDQEIKNVTGKYPVFFVTADGGGIRAAYWTAILLSRLSDTYGTFPRHTFVVSAVSGGSIGATVFSGLVAQPNVADFTGKARLVLGNDFLAPAIGYLFWRDPWTSTFCFGAWKLWRCQADTPDRVIILEQFLEGSWRRSVTTNTFEEPFLDLWAGDRALRVPSLILNSSTNGNSAHRVISNLVPPDGTIQLGPGLRLSTAALLSARFPLISPNGEVKVNGQTEELIDGGYFDNSGAESANIALQEFLQVSVEDKILPIAIIITNDPDAREGHPALTAEGSQNCQIKVDPTTPLPAPLITTPLGTLDGQRANSAELSRKKFIDQVTQSGGEVLRVGLFRCADDLNFPLGWTLSPQVRMQIDDKLERIQHSTQFQRIGQLLASSPRQPPK